MHPRVRYIDLPTYEIWQSLPPSDLVPDWLSYVDRCKEIQDPVNELVVSKLQMLEDAPVWTLWVIDCEVTEVPEDVNLEDIVF